MAGGAASQHKILLAERRYQALELRKMGGSYRDIAAAIKSAGEAYEAGEEGGLPGVPKGYNEGRARDDVMSELQRIRDKSAESAEEVRTLELERLDNLWTVFYPKAMTGDNWAIDKCLSIMASRRAYVNVSAPTKFALTNPEGDEEFKGGEMNDLERAAKIAGILAMAEARRKSEEDKK